MLMLPTTPDNIFLVDNLTNMPPVTLIHNDTFCLREELAAYVRCVPTAFIQHDTQLDNRSVAVVKPWYSFIYTYLLHIDNCILFVMRYFLLKKFFKSNPC